MLPEQTAAKCTPAETPEGEKTLRIVFQKRAESKEAFCTLNFFTYGAFLGYNNGNKKIFERSAFQ